MIRIIYVFGICLLFIHSQAQIAIDSNTLKESIDELVQSYEKLDIFSGVVMVADKGKPIYKKAFGYADRDQKKKNTIHTLFDIGSMNKTFTTIVVKQLIEEGKLKYDDRLIDFINGFKDSKASKITVEHLLNHESGFGDYHTEAYFQASKEGKTLKAIIELIKNDPIFFIPGADRTYSNSGYILLGGIIEKVTGKSYHQNVKERIIIPLGLSNTIVEDVDKYRHRRATGYFKDPFGKLYVNDEFIDLPNPDGGFLSDVSDILTFYRSYYYDDLLISEQMKSKDPFFQFVKNLPSGKAPLMAGGFEGFNTAFFQIYKDDISIIVFCNMDEPAGEHLAFGILQLVRDEKPNKPALPAAQNIVKAFTEQNIEYIKNHFDALTTNFHPEDPKDLILNNVGYAYLYDKDDVESALKLFTLNTELFPDIANVWDSLAEAHKIKGNKKLAIKFYKKVLKINPDSDSAKKALVELDGNRR